MARSQNELVMAVLENLGALAVGQTVSNEDANAIITRIEPKIEELNARLVGYVPYFPDDPDNAIEDVYFLAFAKVMAYEMATTFGVTADKKAALKLDNDDAEEVIRAVGRPKGTRQMLVTEPGFWPRRYGMRWWT